MRISHEGRRGDSLGCSSSSSSGRRKRSFRAVCSGGRGLLTPRKPEKECRRRLGGGLSVPSAATVGVCVPYRWWSDREPERRRGTRRRGGASHQLPAWPGTTITSSSYSSLGTAVSRDRGCGTGSGPRRPGFFIFPTAAGWFGTGSVDIHTQAVPLLKRFI